MSDNGPGIPSENLTKLFNPFFTTKSQDEGTGLGLHISFNIIREHNGQISIQSEPGDGATFIVELPALEKLAPVVRKKPQVKMAQATNFDSREMEILLVDDERVITDLLSKIITSEGYNKITVADHGGTAIAKIKDSNYDLIISDIRMPGVDGREIYNYLQQHKPGMAERIVFTTGNSVSEGVTDFLDQIKTPLLKKPFRIKDVRELLKTMLANQAVVTADQPNSAKISSAVSTSLK